MEVDQPRRQSQRRARIEARQQAEQLRQQREALRNQSQMELDEDEPQQNQQQQQQQGNANLQEEHKQEQNGQQQNQQQVNQEQQQILNPQNPILRQQNQGLIKVSVGMFATKIPNLDALRDFFIHQCKRYCPTMRDMTTTFAKNILCGKKKLLALSDILWVKDAPRYKEICSKAIWKEVQGDQRIAIYMPNYPRTRLPQKAYLLNVMNTVRPNSVIKYIKQLQKKREMIAIEESPIIMTAEFRQQLNQFESISTNRKVQRLNGLRTVPESDNCSICFSVMRSKSVKMFFRCKRHKGHRRCVTAYYNNRQDEQYLCPFRCQDVLEQE